MTKETIEAYNGTGDKKVLAGNREVDKPDTLAEAVEAYGEEYILRRFWTAEVIDIQRQLRGTNGNSNVAKFKRLSPAQQEAVLEQIGHSRS